MLVDDYEEIFMRIKKITVKNLFGMFCHEIPLNMDDHITIIHGPNGIGKTILLKMLNALFRSSYEEFRSIPFSELSVDFDDESTLRLKKRIEPDVDVVDEPGDSNELVFEFSKPGSELKSHTVSLARLQEGGVGVSVREKSLEEFFKTSLPNKTRFEFNDKLPQGVESEPEWLKEIQKSIRIRFIETQRLLSFPDSSRRRKYKESPHMVSTVVAYSKELAAAIQEKLAEYAELSQSLDRTFPTRLVKGNGPSKPTIDELRGDLSKLEEKRSRLMVAGLLDRGEEVDFKEFQEIDESNINVLSVYVHDVKEKLEVLDELTDKIDLLVSIINSRFLYKKMSISKKKGFIFETSDGQSILPTDLSSGEQHELVLNYELLFKVKSNSLILIDEPELSLHVIWQQQFLRDLQEIIKLTGFDVLLATHAPDIIHDRWDLTVELGGSTK
jgi:predicted ATP-binding protein involved in virulence